MHQPELLDKASDQRHLCKIFKYSKCIDFPIKRFLDIRYPGLGLDS